MKDYLALLDDDETAVEKTDERARIQVVEQIEDKLLAEGKEIVSGVMAFAEIEGTENTPPAEWIAELGPEAAIRKLRLARMGTLPASEAPVGVAVAKDMVKSVLAAKAKRQDARGAPELHLEVVRLTLVQNRYEVIDVTGSQAGGSQAPGRR